MVVASIDLHICSFDSAWQNPKSPSPTKHTDFPLRSWINRDEVDDTDDDDDDDDDNAIHLLANHKQDDVSSVALVLLLDKRNIGNTDSHLPLAPAPAHADLEIHMPLVAALGAM